MRIVIITTETLHHAYFLREIAAQFDVERVLIETASLKPPFETAHPFEELREDYEREEIFGGSDALVSDYAECVYFENCNQPDAVKFLQDSAPDAIVVFGAGRIRSDVINVCPDAIVNLHGGDPERYRGLDSHLWAAYHNDFNGFVTSLHRLNAELDDGDIILKGDIKLFANMKIHQLRKANTDVCIDISLAALKQFYSYGAFEGFPQKKKGRYYSFMPAPLKEIAARNFNRRMESI